MIVKLVKAFFISIFFFISFYFYTGECDSIFVNLKIKSDRADFIQLFWSENPIQYFEANSRKISLIKSHNTQTIRFVMPDLKDSVFLRLDFGELSINGNFIIESLSINKGGSSVLFNKEEISKSFFFNENCRFDAISGLLETFSTVNSNDPFCITNKRLDLQSLLKRRPSYFEYITSILIFITAFIALNYSEKI